MIVPRGQVSGLAAAFLAVAFLAIVFVAGMPLVVSGAEAGDGGQVTGPRHVVGRIGDHCAQFGEGFVDVGNGICGRVTSHVRVYVGARNAALDAPVAGWTSGGTSSAALRTNGMVPGAEVTHLRVRGGLDSLSPFQ